MNKFGFSPSKMRFAVIILFAIIMIPLPLRAGGSDAETAQDRPSDFMIRKPGYFLGVHSGMNFPRVDSDLFQMVTRELTLQKSDFRNALIGFDLGIALHEHFALVFSGEYGSSNENSEFRDFVEDNGRAITQRTIFRMVPLTATVRFYPIKTGETVGSYAWIPNPILPYVGGGGGFVHYRFHQFGDFIDMQTFDIFHASLKSSGWVPTLFVVSGVDFGLTPAVCINVEARYSFAKTDLSGDFSGFEPIDLNNLRVSGGINIRF
jgi:opacity protein-like surface antigen